MPYFIIDLVTSKIQGYTATEEQARTRAAEITMSTGNAHAVLKRIAYTYVPEPEMKWIEG
jgi:hypothetical protein